MEYSNLVLQKNFHMQPICSIFYTMNIKVLSEAYLAYQYTSGDAA